MSANKKPKSTPGAAAGKAPRRRATPAQRPAVIYQRKPFADFSYLLRALRQKARPEPAQCGGEGR